jgi:branched-chain amino acid transport system permease protein
VKRLTGPDARRFGSCIFLALVAALMTGTTGNPDHPLDGVRGSWAIPRVLGFLLGGVALWAVWTVVASGRLASVSSGGKLLSERLTSTIESGWQQKAWYAVLLVAAIMLPRALPGYLQQAAFSSVALYALLALGLNVVVGYAGLLDLGFIAFFAIGAYTTAYFSYTAQQKAQGTTPIPWHAPFHLNGFWIFPISALVAAAAGIVLGGPTLRLRGDYLAIVTLGFGEIVQLLANNADGITNGSQGAFGIPPLAIHAGPIDYTWGLDPLPEYYLVLAVIVLVVIAFSRLERSRIGRSWAAIREDEIAAAATGVPTTRMKLLAFAIGASTSGFAGTIFASYQFFNPQSFSFQASILVLTIVIFGGMGSLAGAITGAIVLQGLTAYLQHAGIVPAEDSYIFFGAIVMLMMVFRPVGLIPSRRRKREIQLSGAGVGASDALGPAEGATNT